MLRQCFLFSINKSAHDTLCCEIPYMERRHSLNYVVVYMKAPYHKEYSGNLYKIGILF